MLKHKLNVWQRKSFALLFATKSYMCLKGPGFIKSQAGAFLYFSIVRLNTAQCPYFLLWIKIMHFPLRHTHGQKLPVLKQHTEAYQYSHTKKYGTISAVDMNICSSKFKIRKVLPSGTFRLPVAGFVFLFLTVDPRLLIPLITDMVSSSPPANKEFR